MVAGGPPAEAPPGPAMMMLDQQQQQQQPFPLGPYHHAAGMMLPPPLPHQQQQQQYQQYQHMLGAGGPFGFPPAFHGGPFMPGAPPPMWPPHMGVPPAGFGGYGGYHGPAMMGPGGPYPGGPGGPYPGGAGDRRLAMPPSAFRVGAGCGLLLQVPRCVRFGAVHLCKHMHACMHAVLAHAGMYA